MSDAPSPDTKAAAAEARKIAREQRGELHAEDRPGFWEVRGYSNTALPWQNDRYG